MSSQKVNLPENICEHGHLRCRCELCELEARVIELERELADANERETLATCKCIACGVAATHPDEAVWNGGVYAGKWDSPQAQSVRELRKKCDRLAAEKETSQ